MSIYTRQGDDGRTRLPGGEPMFKDSLALEACGTIDELGASLGLARCEALPGKMARLLERIQHTLLQLNAELADPGRRADALRAVGAAHVEALEADIECCEAKLAPLDTFVLPGRARGEAALHFARTVCRRAERGVISLAQAEPHRVSEHHLAYLNRLSDLLFVLARDAVAGC